MKRTTRVPHAPRYQCLHLIRIFPIQYSRIHGIKTRAVNSLQFKRNQFYIFFFFISAGCNSRFNVIFLCLYECAVYISPFNFPVFLRLSPLTFISIHYDCLFLSTKYLHCSDLFFLLCRWTPFRLHEFRFAHILFKNISCQIIMSACTYPFQ